MPVLEQKRRCNLVLHCGASAVSRIEVARVSTPRPTETWQPIPHVTLIETVEDALRSSGLKIGNQVHSLTQDGARYFGLAEIHNDQNEEDYAMVVGIRNSHDKSFPVGLTAGAQVFVCDNLSFSGEVRLSRKHTSRLLTDLPILVASGVGRLYELWGHQGQRIAAYKQAKVFLCCIRSSQAIVKGCAFNPRGPSPHEINTRQHRSSQIVSQSSFPSNDMKEDQHQFLKLLGQLPARLSVEQTAWVLNCQPHDVPVLLAARLLKPLGNPAPNSIKYFATADVLESAKDRAWLMRVTSTINLHWQKKNLLKKGRSSSNVLPAPEIFSAFAAS